MRAAHRGLMDGSGPPLRAPPRPLLERLGLRYLAARTAARPAARTDSAAHVLDPGERAEMLRVTRGAVLRAALAGACSAGVAAAAEVGATPLLPADASLVSMAALPYWAVLGGVSLVASVVEILFVYWDTLRSVHELARVSGVAAFGPDRPGDEALAVALARAALELPNPVTHATGVNPHREANRWRLLAVSLAYKAKIGVTSFLLKMLVRRILGRVAVRSVVGAIVPFVAVPVTAAWNAIVSYRVVREARIRAMGPSAIEVALGEILVGPEDAEALGPEGRIAVVRAVGSAIVRTEDLHPNLARLLDDVRRHVDLAGAPLDALDDVPAFLRMLPALPERDRRTTLRVLALALALDGRVSSREARLYRQALDAADVPADPHALERLRAAFVAGDGIDHDVLAAVRLRPPV